MPLAGVPDSYRHYPKQAVPMPHHDSGGALLKFYHLERPGEPVQPALAEQARDWLTAPGRFEAGDCGFVILHRCGADFHFLLPTVWRGANEGWEIVAYHQGDMAGFARFDPAYPAPAGIAAPPRPTFCVWELAIVAHEARSWSRFLANDRDDRALDVWREDVLRAEV